MKTCGLCGKQWPSEVRFCPDDETLLGEQVVSDPLSQLVGQVLNQTYRIEEKLAQGGMGAIFRARHLGIGDYVAIKVIKPSLTRSAETLARFRREAQAARRLNHPNAVAVHDFNVTDEGLLFMVMEYVNGETVESYLERFAPLAPARALEILKPVAAALDVAHSLGIIHRDLKPANLMLCQDTAGRETVKVLDFGTARMESLDDQSRSMQGITQEGQIFGTPLYMSPEQFMGEAASAASDIYALGIILYRMLVGATPFPPANLARSMLMHVNERPAPPSERAPGLPRDFDEVVLKAIEKSPADRYSNAATLIERLEATVNAHEIRPAKERLSGAQGALTDTGALDSEEGPISSGVRLSRVKLAALQEPNFDLYVGREAELKRLQEECTNAMAGHARPFFIVGSPGCGKTQLTIRLREWAEQQGALVLMGKFFDYGGSATEPLRLFKNLLLNVLPTYAASSRINSLDDTIEQLRTLLGITTSGGTRVQSEAEKWQIFSLMTTAFSTMSQSRPVVLILDDLQWADALSLDFLGFLLRDSEQHQFFFVGTARAEETNTKGNLFREWLVTQSRYLYYERIDLAPFDARLINELLQSIFHFIEISAKDIELLESLTGGNPFYLVEVVRLLMENQKITFHNGIWRSAGFDEVKLPTTISNVVQYKLEGCAEDLRELLAQAAVIGDDFRFEVLEKVSGLGEEELERLLAAGVKAFLLLEEKNALGDDYRFYHTTVRRVIYDEIPKRQRRRLHARVATALAELNKGKSRTIDGALAYHYHAAGEWPLAYQHAVAALERAYHQLAMDEVIRFSRYAEEALDAPMDREVTAEVRRQLGHLKLQRATALMRLGRFDEAEREAESMRQVLEGLGETAMEARRHLILTEMCYWSSKHAQGVEIGTAGLELARAAGDEMCERNIMYYLAWCQGRVSSHRETMPVFERVVEMAEAARDLALQARALSALGHHDHFHGQWRRGRLRLERACQLARAANNPYAECHALLLFSWMLDYELKTAKFEAVLEEGLKLARACGWRNLEGYFYLVSARHRIRRQDAAIEVAEELLSRSLAIMQDTHDVAGELTVAPHLSMLSSMAAPSPEAAEQLRSFAAIFTSYGESLVNCEVTHELGLAEQRLKRWPAALEAYEQALTLAESVPYLDCQWRIQFHMAECLVALERKDEARVRLAKAVSIIERLRAELDTPEEVEAFLVNKRPVYAAYEKI